MFKNESRRVFLINPFYTIHLPYYISKAPGGDVLISYLL